MTLRAIKALQLPDVTPADAAGDAPTFEWVDPTALLVDGDYQRSLSDRSVNLIRKIVANWDWTRFKPPVVAKGPEGLEVIDGQHTAIAGATHPTLTSIPVMVVVAPERQARASAFVGHNRDRLAITSTQLHFSSVAAGDEDAMTVQQVCERAKVTILRLPPATGRFKVGETMSVAAIRGICNRRGAMGARIILETLVQGQCAPVTVTHIRAVEALLHEREYKGQVEAADIVTTLLRMGVDAQREAAVFATAHSIPQWRALAVVLFKETRRGRRRAA